MNHNLPGGLPAMNPGARGPLMPKMDYQIPLFVERTPQGERQYSPYSKLFEDRIVFLGLVLNDEVADAVMAQLLVLEAQDPSREIILYIHSYGGSSTAMTAIYDTMQYISSPVQTICLGLAASAASVLLAAGHKGGRFALPNSKIMIHQPSIGGEDGIYAQASDIEIIAKEIDNSRKWLENTLSKHTGKPVAEVTKDIERDKYLTAEEALEYGIIDKILDSRKA
jgi:ATP-dependent Clp protease protease subunit